MLLPTDIMTFLYGEYLQEIETRKQERIDSGEPVEEQDFAPSLADFVDFGRNYLSRVNQPMNVTYLTRGLGLRMQRGETISFIPQEDSEPQMRDEGIHITQPATLPNQGLIPANDVPITGYR
jgi:hypothetical protein